MVAAFVGERHSAGMDAGLALVPGSSHAYEVCRCFRNARLSGTLDQHRGNASNTTTLTKTEGCSR
jgi:hypothetical protein